MLMITPITLYTGGPYIQPLKAVPERRKAVRQQSYSGVH